MELITLIALNMFSFPLKPPYEVNRWIRVGARGEWCWQHGRGLSGVLHHLILEWGFSSSVNIWDDSGVLTRLKGLKVG